MVLVWVLEVDHMAGLWVDHLTWDFRPSLREDHVWLVVELGTKIKRPG